MEGSLMGVSTPSAHIAGLCEFDSSLHLSPALHHHQQSQLQGLAPLSTTQHPTITHENEQSFVFDLKGVGHMCNKRASAGTSDDDEPSYAEEGGKSHSGSPWHRMKWTALMVRLLIHNVVLVGEDDHTDNSKKKQSLLQKKGKWKAVSCLMNERGCYVSPQQCEDKFNDLNKRYKRLNDILGKGIACCVVENPSLLDTMDNLTDKAKDNVKKILSSKHLFFKEMCAYHTGSKLMISLDLESQPSLQVMGSLTARRLVKRARNKHDIGEDDDDDLEEDGEEDGYEGQDEETGADAHTEATYDLPSMRRKLSTCLSDSLRTGVVNINPMMGVQGVAQLTLEQQQLLLVCLLQLEEQQVGLQAQALELEKQRFRWQRSRSKKCWELARLKQDNARMKLENERMSLQLQVKELEAERRRSDVNDPQGFAERLQSREQVIYD